MFIQGKIKDYNNGILTVTAPFDDYNFLVDKQMGSCEIRLDDNRLISAEQRKKIYATFKDISIYTGYSPDETKEIMKYCYIEKTGNEYFSLSNTDMTTARVFLEYLIEFCIEWSIPCKESLLNRCPDIGEYLYVCIIHRKCAVCGAKADIHETERVGIGRNRLKINHLNQAVQPLCRKHHSECHYIGQKSFDEKYHLEFIKLDEFLCNRINWKYVNENEMRLNNDK